MKMKFKADAIYNGELIYKAGQVYDVPNENGFADRWIRRGIALPVADAKIEDAKQEAKIEEVAPEQKEQLEMQEAQEEVLDVKSEEVEIKEESKQNENKSGKGRRNRNSPAVDL